MASTTSDASKLVPLAMEPPAFDPSATATTVPATPTPVLAPPDAKPAIPTTTPAVPKPTPATVSDTETKVASPPGRQEGPKSIQLPPPFPASPAPSADLASPDHITAPPAAPPILAAPATATPAAVPHHEDVPPAVSSPAAPKQPQRVDTLTDLSPHTTAQRSRRNSHSDADGSSTKPSVPAARSEKSQTISAPSADRPHPTHPPVDPLHVLLYAGEEKKAFPVSRHTLTSKVPYFAALLPDEHTLPAAPVLTFERMDVHGFGLFVRWVTGGPLHGPTDFQTFTHYQALYCTALHFGVEPLQNETIDLCRAYYRHNNMTAPAYRLEYIYTLTATPNVMRDFLVSTAAFRCLCGEAPAPGQYLSDSVLALFRRGGDLAADLGSALVRNARDGLVDARRGSDEVWHVGEAPVKELREPWESD